MNILLFKTIPLFRSFNPIRRNIFLGLSSIFYSAVEGVAAGTLDALVPVCALADVLSLSFFSFPSRCSSGNIVIQWSAIIKKGE